VLNGLYARLRGSLRGSRSHAKGTGLMDWFNLGRELRQSADSAHEGDTPAVQLAYDFLRDNPECFGFDEWPEPLPVHPPADLVLAYFGDEISRCNEEIAQCESAIRSGHPETAGACLGLADWSAELRMLKNS
jgi:hypothetical protein